MPNKFAIPLIIVSQFCCTSLWFAGNAIIEELAGANEIQGDHLVTWTIMVQLGFIIGTIITAFLLLADRYSPSKVFLIAGLVGGVINFGLLIPNQTAFTVAILRFLSGLSLAGIYPIGMKIAADYRKEGLGIALGFLVGALVLGTAFPHLLKNLLGNFSWKWVVVGISLLSIIGAFLVFIFVKNGPYRKAQTKFDSSTFLNGFKNRKFRAAAFGYFGHMWELYAFWTFVPVIIGNYLVESPEIGIEITLPSFAVIAIGGIGCIIGGYLANRWSSQKVSILFLFGSMICCLLSPFIYQLSFPVLMLFLLTWGFLVAGDSPQFSTLVANYASPENKGSSLTIVNGIGFSITIVALMLLGNLSKILSKEYLLVVLAIGPMLGVFMMYTTFYRISKDLDN